MEAGYEQNGPVVIGGVGGSGTRVVAMIVSDFGFYIGDDLNASVDNLWYTLLFKRRKWYYDSLSCEEEIHTGLGILRKVMLKRGMLSVPECRFLIQAVVEIALHGHNPLSGAGKGLWPFKRVWRMIKTRRGKRSGYVGWGWKEPSSRLLIRHQANYFEHLKYIHTMRHGLDMAFSRNRQEIYLWGPLYGVDEPRTPSEIPAAALRYWLGANRCALQAGRELGKDKFHVIDFDRLCSSPESEIQSLVSFLQINPSREAREKARTLIRDPGTTGRYRDHDLSQFDGDDLSALRTFGYDVE